MASRLRCPNCRGPLALEGYTLACAAGHRFDVARQGYVSLFPPRGRSADGDTPAMLEARERFLAKGHFAPIADALPREDGLVAEIGAGTGYYLAAAARGKGIALDASKAAMKRVRPFAAIACDVWREIPLQDGVAALVLVVFAPRNGPEIARVLAPGGRCVVVTPTPDHLLELHPLGLLDIDPLKEERLATTMQPLRAAEHQRLDFPMTLDREDIRALIGMGPSAHHVDLAALDIPTSVQVTGSVSIDTFVASDR